MADKAAIRRTRETLAQERLRLKQAQLDLERRDRQLRQERADAVVVLRTLCAHYGDNHWADDTPLATVLADHLARPLIASLEDAGREFARLSDDLARARRQLHEASLRPISIADVRRGAR